MTAPARYGEHERARPGLCEGCGKPAWRLVTDHCHEHGWVRARVCGGCNVRLGFIDRRRPHRVDEVLLTALAALHARCPDCDPVDPAGLRTEDPGVRVALRMPRGLHRKVQHLAEAPSLNDELLRLIKLGITKEASP